MWMLCVLLAHQSQAVSEVVRCAGEIARLAMKRGLINCNGKTPDATMASALYTDLKRRDVNSIFIRPHEGLFGLREWTTEENGHFEVGAQSHQQCRAL